jgi:hypothetical protein
MDKKQLSFTVTEIPTISDISDSRNMKAMSYAIVIIVTSVVVLIVGLVVMGIFSGGMGTFQGVFNPLAQQTGDTARCESTCTTLCSLDSTTGYPESYPLECTESGHVCLCHGSDMESGIKMGETTVYETRV